MSKMSVTEVLDKLAMCKYWVCSNQGIPERVAFSFAEAKETKAEYLDGFDDAGSTVISYALNDEGVYEDNF